MGWALPFGPLCNGSYIHTYPWSPSRLSRATIGWIVGSSPEAHWFPALTGPRTQAHFVPCVPPSAWNPSSKQRTGASHGLDPGVRGSCLFPIEWKSNPDGPTPSHRHHPSSVRAADRDEMVVGVTLPAPAPIARRQNPKKISKTTAVVDVTASFNRQQER